MKSRSVRLAAGMALLALGACQTSKSSTPTAPTVAGPIPGVNISAPGLLEPSQGFKFKESEQPIRLVVHNATTNGVRPLFYTFEVSGDSSFASKVFSRSNVPPGENNKTSVQLDRLEIGRAYYWRAWAEDGANTGSTATAGFEIHPKPAVTPPTAIAPVNNELIGNTTPTITVNNAQFIGPVGHLAYEFQVAIDQSFNSSPLTSATTMFWRVRASDGETLSSWSGTQSFRTPALPKPPTPAPVPSGGGGGGSCASNNGNAIITCISAKYPDKLVAGISHGQRQANMIFLRDRIIEAGKCGGLDLGWNLKRGGPELSIDFITNRTGGLDGIDIGFAYDDTSHPLRLSWQTGGSLPFYAAYTNSFSCGS